SIFIARKYSVMMSRCQDVRLSFYKYFLLAVCMRFKCGFIGTQSRVFEPCFVSVRDAIVSVGNWSTRKGVFVPIPGNCLKNRLRRLESKILSPLGPCPPPLPDSHQRHADHQWISRFRISGISLSRG